MIISFSQFLRQRFAGTSTSRIKKIVLEQIEAEEPVNLAKKPSDYSINSANAETKVPEFAIRWLHEENKDVKSRIETALVNYLQPIATGMAGAIKRSMKYRFAQRSPVTPVDMAGFVMTNLFQDINRFGAVTDWSKKDEKEITSSYTDRMRPEYNTPEWHVDKRWLSGITLDGTCPESYRCIICRWYKNANGDKEKLTLGALLGEIKKSVSIMCSHYWFGVVRGQEERLQDGEVSFVYLDDNVGGDSGEWHDKEQSVQDKVEDQTPVGMAPDKASAKSEKEDAYIDFFTQMKAYFVDWCSTLSDADATFYKKVFDTVVALVRQGEPGLNSSRMPVEKSFFTKVKDTMNDPRAATWQDARAAWNYINRSAFASHINEYTAMASQY